MPFVQSQVKILYLSGLGRRLPGSQFAELANIRLKNGELDQIPTDITGSVKGVNLKLDGFSTNTFAFNEPTTGPSESYTSLSMFLNEIREEDFNGNLNPVFSGPAILLPDMPIAAELRPGRTTTVQIYLNNGSLFYDDILDEVVFDQDAWDQDNLIDGATAVPGKFSDAVSFSLGGVGLRPAMEAGGTADRVLMTGDSIGLGQGSVVDGSFDLYSPQFVESGSLNLPDLLAGNPTGQPLPGTYTVLEPNTTPFDPDAPDLPALQGTWYDFNDVVSNVGTDIMFIIPSSDGDNIHQVALVKRSSTGVIQALWIGRVELDGTTGTFTVWSVDQIDDNTENNPATGTLSNVTIEGTRIADGDWNVTNTPTGFPFETSGVFVVYN